MDRARKLEEIARLRQQIIDLEIEAGVHRAPTWPAPPSDAVVHQLLADFATDFVSIHAANGDYLFASDSVERMLGYTVDEMIGRSAYEFFHEEDLARIAADHASQADREHGKLRYRLRQKNGDYRWVETASSPRKVDDEVEQIVCITRDVHDEENATRAMIDAERHASIGLLVGAISHEISGPLTAALMRLPDFEDGESDACTSVRDALDEIADDIRSAANVVAELRLLATSDPSEPEPVCLARAVERLLTLCRGTTSAKFDLELQKVNVRVDRPRLHQLAHHLFRLHAGGALVTDTISVRTSDAGNGHGRLEISGPVVQVPGHVRADLLRAMRGMDPGRFAGLQMIESICEEIGGTWELSRDDQRMTSRVDVPLAD